MGIIKIERWAIPKPSDALIKDYEEKRTNFTTQLNINIERRLLKMDRTDEDKLTDRQKTILNFWKEGIYIGKEIAKKMGLAPPCISENINWMKNKGFFLEHFRN